MISNKKFGIPLDKGTILHPQNQPQRKPNNQKQNQNKQISIISNGISHPGFCEFFIFIHAHVSN